MIEDSKLVAALRESNAITEDDLKRGLEISENTGRPLYHTIIDHELADETAAVRVAAELLNVPFVELEDVHPEPEVLEQIPPTLAFRNMVFPLKISEEDGQRELFLAMADPIDVLAMDEVATHTGIDIRPVLAGPRDLKLALERAYHRDADGPEPFSDVEPFGADFDLDEISSFDHQSDLDEDSWEAFFDEAEDAEEEDVEDSMVLSREMRDRQTSQELDPFEHGDGESSVAEDEALQSLEEPLSQSQMTGGVETDLSDWEIDERLEGEESQEDKDYAAIGSFFVYSSEDARKERLQDLADFEERESGEVDSIQKQQARQQADGAAGNPPSEPISGPELSSAEDDAVSGVTSMSEAPFMFEEDDPDASDSIELQEVVEDDAELDEDSGGHTMVGRGIGLDDEESEDDELSEADSGGHTMVGAGIAMGGGADESAELQEASAAEGSDDDSSDDEEGDDGTSMLGGPFGIGMSEDSAEEADDEPEPEQEQELGEESSGGYTMVGSIHAEDDSQAETVDGEIDVLDDDDVELLDESSVADLGDEESFGSQTQFGVGPQGPGAPAAGAPADDDPTDEDLEASGNDSKAPLAGITRRDTKKSDDKGGRDEESTKSRLSGLLNKVRDKKKSTQEKSANARTTTAKADTSDQDRQTAKTAENPVAKAQKADDGEIRETQPNRAVTELRAQAMQEEAGLSSVFAKAVARTNDLDEDDVAALAELSPDELVYVTLLALFEKDVLSPRDILDQFKSDDS